MRSPQMGDFGLTKGKGLAMWFIRHATASRYGHACVVLRFVDGAENHVLIVEAMPEGARARYAHISEFVWSNLHLTDQQRHDVAAYAERCRGLPYDWWAIIGFAIRFWRAKWTTGSGDHADDKVICSELVAWAYREAGVDLAPGYAPGDVSPGDLAQWLFNRYLEQAAP